MVWLSSSLFLPFLEENSCFRSIGPASIVEAEGLWKHLINPLIPVPLVGLSECLTLMVRLPQDQENIQRSQLNPFFSSLPLSLSHTHVQTNMQSIRRLTLSFPMFSQEGNPKLLFLSQGGISSISHDKTQVLTDKVKEKLSMAS